MIDRIFPPKPKSEQSSREKVSRKYYGKLIPFAYSDFLGILGFFKYLMILVIGLFKPIFREVRNSDMRIVAHKTCALAAENFMLSMAAEGYDTCPMEGFEADKYNTILGLSEKNLNAAVALPIGYRSEEDETQHYAKVRQSKEELFTYI